MADGHGSQCGFCTPGFVMSCGPATAPSPTVPRPRGDRRRTLAGNLCRCTGYRPILDARVPSAAPPARLDTARRCWRRWRSRAVRSSYPPAGGCRFAAPCARWSLRSPPGWRCPRRALSPAAPTSACGSPKRSGASWATDLSRRGRARPGRGPTAQLRIGGVPPRWLTPTTRSVAAIRPGDGRLCASPAAAPCRHAGRQRRQWLADRRFACAGLMALDALQIVLRRGHPPLHAAARISTSTTGRTASSPAVRQAVGGAAARRRRFQVRRYKISKRFDWTSRRSAPLRHRLDGKTVRTRAWPSAAWRRSSSAPRRPRPLVEQPGTGQPKSAGALPRDFHRRSPTCAPAPPPPLVAANLLMRFWLETRAVIRCRRSRPASFATMAHDGSLDMNKPIDSADARPPRPPVGRRPAHDRHLHVAGERRLHRRPARARRHAALRAGPSPVAHGRLGIALDAMRARCRRGRRADGGRHPRRQRLRPIVGTTPSSRPVRATNCATSASRFARCIATHARAGRRAAAPRRCWRSSRCRPSPLEAHEAPVRAAAHAAWRAAMPRSDAAAPHRLKGRSVGGQEQFYLEGQWLRHPRRGRGMRCTARPAPRARCSTWWRTRWACRARRTGGVPAHGRRLRRQGVAVGLFACVAAVARPRLAELAGEAAPRPRRRLRDHRPPPLLRFRRGSATTTGPRPGRRDHHGLARRPFGRPVRPGDDAARCATSTTPTGCPTRPCTAPARRPTRRATPPSAASAGRRARSPSESSIRSRAAWASTRWTCGAPTSTAGQGQRHALRPEGRGQRHPELVAELEASATTAAPRPSPPSTTPARCSSAAWRSRR